MKFLWVAEETQITIHLEERTYDIFLRLFRPQICSTYVYSFDVIHQGCPGPDNYIYTYVVQNTCDVACIYVMIWAISYGPSYGLLDLEECQTY